MTSRAVDGVWSSDLAEALDGAIRPYVQSHGGDVEVVDVQGGEVSVEFRAACSACELRAITFAATVRPRLLAVPGVTAVTCDAVALTPARLDEIARFFRSEGSRGGALTRE